MYFITDSQHSRPIFLISLISIFITFNVSAEDVENQLRSEQSNYWICENEFSQDQPELQGRLRLSSHYRANLCVQGEKDLGEISHRMRRLQPDGQKHRRGQFTVLSSL